MIAWRKEDEEHAAKHIAIMRRDTIRKRDYMVRKVENCGLQFRKIWKVTRSTVLCQQLR